MATTSLTLNEDLDEAFPDNGDNKKNANDDDSENDNDDNGSCLFSCQCESAKSVSTLLSCLRHVGSSALGGANESIHSQHYTKNSTTLVTVYCSPSSLTFHVYGKARQSQASVDMQAGLFSEYYIRRSKQQNTQNTYDNDNDNDDDTTASQTQQWHSGGEFCVSLNTVMECLHVLGSTGLETTKLCISYDTDTEIFRLELLDERGVLSTAAIPGVVPEHASSSLAHAFRSSPIVARMIVKSDILKEAMIELDLVHGATVATVALSKDNGLELAAVGDAGECVVSLPTKGTVSLESSPTQQRARNYPLHSFRSGMKALEIAEETCVSINGKGMMAIQHQVLDHVGKGTPNFVDFIMGCLEDDDEDDQDNNGGEEEDYPQGQHTDTAMSHPSQSQTSLEMPTQSQRSYHSRTNYNNDDHDEHDTTMPSPSPRPKPREKLVYRSDREEDNDHDDDDDEEENGNLPITSAQPLFGTLELTTDTSQVASSSLRANRRKQSFGRRRSRPMTSTDHGTGSQEDDDGDDDDSVDNDDDEEMTIIPSTPQRQKRNSQYDDDDEGMSSPEVVYGEGSLKF